MDYEDTTFSFDFLLASGVTTENFHIRLDNNTSSYYFFQVGLGSNGSEIQATNSATFVKVADVTRDVWTHVEISIGTELYLGSLVYSSTYTISVTSGGNTTETTLSMYRNKSNIERLAITSDGDGTGKVVYLDNVYLGTPVPEPVTAGLLISGGAIMLIRRRRII